MIVRWVGILLKSPLFLFFFSPKYLNYRVELSESLLQSSCWGTYSCKESIALQLFEEPVRFLEAALKMQNKRKMLQDESSSPGKNHCLFSVTKTKQAKTSWLADHP